MYFEATSYDENVMPPHYVTFMCKRERMREKEKKKREKREKDRLRK